MTGNERMKNSSRLFTRISWDQEIVGLIPAAGTAKRIAPLPFSKELFPIGYQKLQGRLHPYPKVVCQYLLEKFQCAGINQAYIVLRKGKWDIPAYFGDGELVNMHLSYLIMREPFGPPFTLDQAYPFVCNKLVAFGFPDIMFSPQNVFKQLLEYQVAKQGDVVLALFPAHNPEVMDMVGIDKNGKIHTMLLKPLSSDLHFTWLCGVWTPVFTQFMHEYLQSYLRKTSLHNDQDEDIEHADLTVGAVLQAAIENELEVHGVIYPNRTYIDIGTPEDLVKSVGLFGCHVSS